MTLKALRAELSALQSTATPEEKIRPPEDVTRRYNESGYMDPMMLYQVPLWQQPGTNNWFTLPVMALDDERFRIFSRYGELVFRDEDLKPDHNGKIIINIEHLRLSYGGSNEYLPQEFELPLYVLEKRREKRRLKALAKDAVFIDRNRDPWIYYYIEDSRLRILSGDKEATADQIETVYGRPAVKVEALDLGHLYLELPEDVAQKFEKVLLEKALKSLTLVPVGVSLLNGLNYYGFNMGIPNHMFNPVKQYFSWFGDVGELKGWLTCYPEKVAGVLGIPIQ